MSVEILDELIMLANKLRHLQRLIDYISYTYLGGKCVLRDVPDKEFH